MMASKQQDKFMALIIWGSRVDLGPLIAMMGILRMSANYRIY